MGSAAICAVLAGCAGQLPRVPAVVAPVPALAPVPAYVPPPAPAPEYAPQDLIGLDVSAVELLLGEPGLRRREPTAQVWQYVHADCVLFVFLYDTESGPPKVTHAETGGRVDDAVPDPVACVTDLVARGDSSG